MVPNILLSQPPGRVKVGEVMVPLRTSHRAGIQAMRLLDDPSVSEEDRARTLLFIFFGRRRDGASRVELPREVLANPGEALYAASDFLAMGEPSMPRIPGSSKQGVGVRTFCWDGDAARIAADFRREYGIDLSDPATNLHWWHFWSLFRGLSEESQVMRAIGIRSAVPDEKTMGRASADELARRQIALMLPARTQEEAGYLTALRHRGMLEK